MRERLSPSRRTVSVVAEISGKKADKKFAEDRGLPHPSHEEAPERGTESDENGSDENGHDRIAVREVGIGVEAPGKNAGSAMRGREVDQEHPKNPRGIARAAGSEQNAGLFCGDQAEEARDKTFVGVCVLQCAVWAGSTG